MPGTTIIRARVAHTPRDPFATSDALETFDDGAVAFDQAGTILATGPHAAVAEAHPAAETLDRRDCVLLPGLIDTHVHFPQIPVIGAMGLELLDWLAQRTLPEEAKMADLDHATKAARRFTRLLARNGTTSALVFGSHFPHAQHALFEAADASGLRIASGLVVSDRNLRPELEVTPDEAYEHSRVLIDRWHGHGRLRYAVTPRFSVSASEPMLAASKALLDETAGALFTSHVNESVGEIAFVKELFPDARDYVATYEDAGLLTARSVLAHNVHVSDDELARLAHAHTAVAHCPSSNAFLSSGIFPMARHVEHGVRFGMGTDVGAGTGLSMLKEGLVAYHVQMVRDQGHMLGPAHLLYLATAAGAKALNLGDMAGDLTPGKQADLVLIKPPLDGTLEAVLEEAPDWDAALGAIFTLAREEAIAETRVAGEVVWSRVREA
ncbi:guanine deaminase [Solirubrobacter sp. CPCC 204708]|uniref:Guanine deaminase n=1 Tax=Solirubrobacter deserti TaxID=2282478 RepID=A0ABT4RU09_9ACTN|nr:guanine deaminase [Solirubrobacter deserti]MBE2316262.1 guanine deaminase [Solirubrobacter deserti]MDA0142058.1 guanine deaminase [Solirubrobacter deserti]